MKKDNDQQQQNDQQKNQQENVTPLPTPNNATGGSMSEGNLSNSRYGREKGTTVHEKTTIMGSDDDGQAG